MFSVSNHSVEASIETKRKIMWTRSKWILKTHKPTECVDSVQIISFCFLLKLNIMFCVSNHSLVGHAEIKWNLIGKIK